MEEKTTACTGLKCPLKQYCIYFANHVNNLTKLYFMAEFDAETGKCRNFKQLK